MFISSFQKEENRRFPKNKTTKMINKSHRIVQFLFAILSLTMVILLPSCGEKQSQPPYEPQNALSTFQLPEGFKIELVASEPLISDPVEIAFDEDGKIYVVQMDDYPSENMDDYGAGPEPKSKIMLLEDKDGDGFYESGTVFAEGLQYANGVMPWNGGVLVTSAPDVFFLKDTDGDGKADEKKIVLTGFAVTNPQLRASSLRYELDNWIYAAYSRAGGGRWREEFKGKGSPLHFPERPELKLPELLPGTNIRFLPDEYKIEASGGMSQFGLSFDQWGNQFTVWNNVHVRNVVINDKYLSANPFLSINATMADISDHGNAAPVYAITKDMMNLHESEMGHFTSACGICEYTGGIFTGKYENASFVCEPVSNLVHVDLIAADPPTFKAERILEEKEFLASTDSWFRPVNLTVGPDGAMYVVDFYRKMVEHPDWLAMADSSGFYTHAGKIKESDFLEGNDRGRIYRIVPKDFKRDKYRQPEMSKADVGTLVNYLKEPNRWWRINAQRLLVEQKHTDAVSLLIELLSEDISPETKIHVLWTLDGLNALPDSLLKDAFESQDPHVRKQAVLLGEKRIDKKDFLNLIIQASSDSDPNVQFQVALTLSRVAKTNPEIFGALKTIISLHMNNSWFQKAVLLGASEDANQWFGAFKDFNNTNGTDDRGKKEFLQQVTSITGARYKQNELSGLIGMISSVKDTGVAVAALKGLSEGMKRNTEAISLSPAGQDELLSLISDNTPAVRTAAIGVASQLRLIRTGKLNTMLNSSREVALNQNQSLEDRVNAVQIIGLSPGDIPFGLMDKLLQPEQPSGVQLAVVNVLLKDSRNESTSILLNKWNLFNPKIHEVVENGFIARKNRVEALLKAIETNKIKSDWVSRNIQNRLLKYSDSSVRESALKLFRNSTADDRQELIYSYNEATMGGGDPVKGKAVFKNSCSTCHTLDGVGVDFGPDLHSVSHQTRINLLTMILDPNHDIAAGFEGYTIETKDGNTVAGIIANENNESIVLKSPGGIIHTIMKSDVNSINPLSVSLMTEGLETLVSKGDMADLLEYIKTLK